MSESEAPKEDNGEKRPSDAKILRPKDAATLVIIDRTHNEPKVLMGKRRAGWLIVLAPILILFYQRFAGDEFRRMAILVSRSGS